MQQEHGIRAVMSEEELVSLYPVAETRQALVRRIDHFNRKRLISLEEGVEVLRLGEDGPEGSSAHPVYDALARIKDFGGVVTAAAVAERSAEEATL